MYLVIEFTLIYKFFRACHLDLYIIYVDQKLCHNFNQQKIVLKPSENRRMVIEWWWCCLGLTVGSTWVGEINGTP